MCGRDVLSADFSALGDSTATVSSDVTVGSELGFRQPSFDSDARGEANAEVCKMFS